MGTLRAVPSVHLPASLWDRPCHGDAEFAGGDQAESWGGGVGLGWGGGGGWGEKYIPVLLGPCDKSEGPVQPTVGL